MKKNALFIGNTHGDENIGTDALDIISKQRQDFDWIIGNVEARKRGVRFTQKDLNRSAPGNQNSLIYEEKRAAEIIELAKQYKYTIDIHGTRQETGIFLIVTNLTKKNFELAALFNIDKIVLLPSFSEELNSPLSEFFECGLEIECGNKFDPKIFASLQNTLLEFLDKIKGGLRNINHKDLLSKKEIYLVYGSIPYSKNIDSSAWSEFGRASHRGENFFTLFVGTYAQRAGVQCYKMRRLGPLEIKKLLRQ